MSDLLPGRWQPIPPPGDPLQYRAIGLLKGRYQPSEEMFNRGILHTTDGTTLETVLLGRVKHLINKHLDLDSSYLWVVYPRTPGHDKGGGLQVQIMGIWDPEAMNQPLPPEEVPDPVPDSFSIRGEVIFQSAERELVVVKIRQAKPKQPGKRATAFKLELSGLLPDRGLGCFWDLQVMRRGSALAIESAEMIAPLPKAPPRPRRDKYADKKGDRSKGGPQLKPYSTRPQLKKSIPSPRPARAQDPAPDAPSSEAAPPRPRPPIIDRRKRQPPNL